MGTRNQNPHNFVAEPMGEKHVTELSGVGEVLGQQLELLGYNKAYVVLGKFLVLKKNRELFLEWMIDQIGASYHAASECYECLEEWCLEFL